MATNMTHYARRQKRLIESIGAQVAAFDLTGSGHLRFVVVTPAGAKHKLVCGSTPSDWRADRNMLALVRKWCAKPAANEPVYVR